MQNKVKNPTLDKGICEPRSATPRKQRGPALLFPQRGIAEVGFREWGGSESTRAQSKDPNIKQPVFKSSIFRATFSVNVSKQVNITSFL